MSFAAAAVVGGSLIGGMMSANAASDAASAQRRAASDATAEQRRQYDQTRADYEPWRMAGLNALNQLTDQLPFMNRQPTMADLQMDPGYDFRMQEANKAIERSAAARGGLNSGATLKALTRYNQDAASQEYNNAYNRFTSGQDTRFNRLASIAGLGQTATGQVANAGMNAANNVSQNMLQSGNAQAAGYIGQANAINSGIGQGINTWMNYQAMNRAFPTNGG